MASSDRAIDAGAVARSDTTESPTIVPGIPHDSTESDSTHLEKPIEVHNDSPDEWPHGFKLVMLAGASLVSVFLVALDQVRIRPQSENLNIC